MLSSRQPAVRLPARTWTRLFGGLAVVVVVVVAAAIIAHLRARAIGETEHQLDTLTAVLSEQSVRAVQSAELLLDSLERYAEASGRRDELGSAAGQTMLRNAIANMPQVKYATVADADGRIVVSSIGVPFGDVRLDDRYYFQVQRDTPGGATKVVDFVVSRVTGERLIVLSRRWDAPDSDFLGVLSVSLDPLYFEGLYGSVSRFAGSAVALLRGDGVFVAHHPARETLTGRTADAETLRAIRANPEGQMVELAGAESGRRRYHVQRTVAGYPLLVVASIDKQGVLASWYREIAIVATGAAVAVAAIVLLLIRLQASSAEAGRILDAAADALALLDAEGRIVRVNARLESMFGRTAGELRGQPISRLLSGPPDADRGSSTAALEATASARRPDGTVFPVEASVEPVMLAGVTFRVATIRDLTDRRRAESEVREAREMFAAIVDASPMAIVALDPSRRVLVWNRAAELATGYAAIEVVGHPYPLVPKDGEAEFDRYFHSVLAGESQRDIEVLRQRKDGTLRLLKFSGEPLFDAERRVRAVIYVLEDVTERKALEDQLRQSQKMEAIGQLTGGIAHDFNNMLTVIMGNAEVLLARLAGDRQLHAVTEMILKAADGSADLTRRLLTFARRQPLQPKRTAINPFVERMGGLLKRVLGENVETRLSLAPDVWEVMADPSQLETAILNLAINARDAMPGGGRLTIETRNIRFDAPADPQSDIPGGDFVLVGVSDDGSGMAPETLRRAFEPFFTTKAIGRGTGLGLSMVYGFVRQSGGHVRIYSELGEGTSVKIYLPRASAVAAAEENELDAAEPPTGRGEAVLVVEDEALLRDFVAGQLRDLGYRVAVAADGAEAMAILQGGGSFDLLFTDMVMPGGMSGRELAERAHALRPSMGVLFTSAYTPDAIVHHGRLGVAMPVLGKPYRRRELAAKVREALDRPAMADAGRG